MGCNLCGKPTARVRVGTDTDWQEKNEALCDECKRLPIAIMQQKIADGFVKKESFQASAQYGTVWIKPLKVMGSKIIGYKLRNMIPDTTRYWQVEADESGELKAYYL